MVTLRKQGSVWYLDSTYDERHLAKSAGFWWHGGNGCSFTQCAACDAQLGRVWWTRQIEIAVALRRYADDTARHELNQFAAATAAAVQASQAVTLAPEEIPAVPVPAGLRYYPFQLAGIRYMLERTGVLLADEMGLGKTVEVLGLVNADPSLRKILVLCPASLRLNWHREARRWLVRKPHIHVVETRELPPDTEELLLIVNYDRLVGQRGQPLVNWILARTWDLLVADEAHALKDRKAQRTQIVLGAPKCRGGIAARARRKVFATGTPFLNRPVEIFPILSTLRPDLFANFWEFTRRYCDGHRTKYGYRCDGATNLAELQEKLRTTVMVRRRKVDVLPELPKKIRQIIVLPADLAEERNAVIAESRALERIGDTLASLRAAVLVAKVSCSHEAYRESVARLQEGMRIAFSEITAERQRVALAKLPAVAAHTTALLTENPDRKVVVWAHHRQVANGLFEALEKAGMRPAMVLGETSTLNRDAEVQRFQADPTCRVFVGSIRAAGLGITLTAGTIAIFAELDWVPAILCQAEDRLHRIGQSEPVLIQHLVLDGSLDARIAGMLLKKQEILDKALDLPQEGLQHAAMIFPFDVDDELAELPHEYPSCTEEQQNAALAGLRILATLATATKIDREISLRLMQNDHLSPSQFWLAWKILPKYQQLPRELLEKLNVRSSGR